MHRHQYQMKISVIVPVLNEEESIRGLLDGLLRQSRLPDEIVITDGGSTDATPLIIEEYVARYPSVRLLRETQALPGRGRNVAAANSTSEWLAFIDAGVIPADDWLAQLANRAAQDPTAGVVFGSWEPVTDTFFQECAAIAYAGVPNRADPAEVERARAIFSSLMRRTIWQAVGGFPEHLRSAEDLLFISKLDQQPAQITYAAGAVVRWEIEPAFGRTYRRFVVYSRNNLVAGLWRQWQAAMFGRYVVLVLSASLLFVLTRWWALILVAISLLLFLGRSVLALVRNRRTFPASAVRNLRRLTVLVPLLITIDAATIAGAIEWLLRDKLGLLRA